MTTSTTHPVPLGLSPSFGFGDRLGSATPGHLAALREAGGPIAGIFAQQSIREMRRTRRTASEVMYAATDALSQLGDVPTGQWGADADHLKTEADVRETAEAGFVFFTIDPSDYVDQKADGYSEAELEVRYTPTPWVEDYRGRTVAVPDGPTITFDDLTLKRAAVKYGRAMEHALELAGSIRSITAGLGQSYEIEVSVDETDEPTTLAEHYIIAEQLTRGGGGCDGLGDKLVSLAPRFIGDLQKGVDYIGDLDAFESSLRDHAAIATHLGPYKLSLHSGSDKLSIYAALGRATAGRFHVKTAGTSYLEALRVVAIHEPAMFRELIAFSRDRYNTDRATYHVAATLDNVPPDEAFASDADLIEAYLGHWDRVPDGAGFAQLGRQVLHCTFGSVLTDAEWGSKLRQVLTEHAATYTEVLREHFVRHLQALNAG